MITVYQNDTKDTDIFSYSINNREKYSEYNKIKTGCDFLISLKIVNDGAKFILVPPKELRYLNECFPKFYSFVKIKLHSCESIGNGKILGNKPVVNIKSESLKYGKIISIFSKSCIKDVNIEFCVTYATLVVKIPEVNDFILNLFEDKITHYPKVLLKLIIDYSYKDVCFLYKFY